jgi:DNA-binding LacI/PurR family transcriptional regulator
MNADPKPPLEASAPRRQRVQMADLARLAGVSTSTVSRALNDSPLVGPETTRRIRELAKSLNYTINEGAKNLRTGNNRTVAVVIPFDAQTRQSLSDPFFLALLGCLADTLTERGYDMLVTRVDAEHLETVAHVYETGKALGIILVGQWHHHDQLNELSVRGVPFVVWGANLPAQLYCTVGSDNPWGGYIATRHLLVRGRKKLLFLGDITQPEFGQRHEGFVRALREHGLTPKPEDVINCAYAAELAEASMQRVLDEKRDFDGIVASGDLLAIAAINTLKNANISVPDKVAVIGYDDIPQARYCVPPLTTVVQPLSKGAELLVDALLASARGEKPLPRSIPTELQVRGSG